MPLPQKYRKPVDDLFAGRITGKELQEIIEWIDSAQMGFEFKKTNTEGGEITTWSRYPM